MVGKASPGAAVAIMEAAPATTRPKACFVLFFLLRDRLPGPWVMFITVRS